LGQEKVGPFAFKRLQIGQQLAQMLLHRLARRQRITRLKRGKDRAVFVKRGLQSALDRQDQLARAMHVQPCGLRHMGQPGKACEGQEHIMHLAIQLHEPLLIRV
jgi:hypothetical protein